MTEIYLNYCGKECCCGLLSSDRTIKEICEKHCRGMIGNLDEAVFIYNDTMYTFDELDTLDLEEKIGKRIVIGLKRKRDCGGAIMSKFVFCSECFENARFSIKNYKISLHCPNGHKINNLSFEEFEKNQNIDKIICNQCEKKKSQIYNNEFNKCLTCKMNLCPYCRGNHTNANIEHKIIDYDKVNFICPKHYVNYISYCNQCKINICRQCENEHLNHDKVVFESILKKREEYGKKLNELKRNIDIFKKSLDEVLKAMTKTFVELKETLNKYFNTKKNILIQFSEDRINYYSILNLNEIIDNKEITEDINKIIQENNIQNRYSNIINLYNKINNINNNNTSNDINNNTTNKMKENKDELNINNKINLQLNIEKGDINKCIYFLDNTNRSFLINKKFEVHNHDFLKELNDSNVELYINEKKYIYQKYFKPEKEGIHNITLKIKIRMKDCSFMFYDCSKITSIDLSSFDTKDVINMGYMFHGCINVTNINLSSFNTSNTTNMRNMFNNCNKLENINLITFDTKKVKNMGYMFQFCQALKKLDLTHFDTTNVSNMEYMFSDCTSLTDIDLSSFVFSKNPKLSCIFSGCKNLKIKINRNACGGIEKELKGYELIKV